ncbi:MAG: lysozyme inhibitor LprI family protein [Albidovulum sp.]|uniref:lysozyme inhibitor LprI family protein n=1 Tax=Albidovulum sp. TaxID=1872424 RepID=UPI003C91484D
MPLHRFAALNLAAGLCAAAILSFMSTAAFADPTLECDRQSQVEIADCLAGVEANVDRTVETALGLAMDSAKELDGVTGRDAMAPALTVAQAAWTAYRDAECEAVGASFGGGSGTGIAIRACRIDLGRERVARLMQSLN